MKLLYRLMVIASLYLPVILWRFMGILDDESLIAGLVVVFFFLILEMWMEVKTNES